MMLTIAKTIPEVSQAVGEIQAGGTDVQARRRRGITDGPVVDIHRLPELRAVAQTADGGTTIGALVTVHTIATDPLIQAQYAGLAQAAGGLATPQIRWMASLGGALLQRTRCHFYRHPNYRCFKNGGNTCYARDGYNPNGVLFDLGPCVYPHPSTLGMALLVYEAEVVVNGREPAPIATLYGDGSDPSRDHTLQPSQLLTHIHLPPPTAGEQTAYFRAISRFEAEWPIVECLVRLVIEAGTIQMARVGVGGVANIPLRLRPVEAALEGQPYTEAALATAAQQALQDVNPLPQTSQKVPLLAGTVLETLQRAVQGHENE